ncbi:hypothetical protein V1525DRAFT_386063 [Lipomyces kononenkoae]|uniref:Uncharacterized protein n=1 Tax=Lipomyces kononenkoae TaxID=34357 RepID=A0ACC3T7Y8_LIPKO
MINATVTINSAKQSEVAVAGKGATATCSESAAKNPDGRGLFAKLLHRKASKVETPTNKVRLLNPFSLADKDHSQRKHFRDWFRRKTSSSHVDGQKHWCSRGFKVSSLRIVEKVADSAEVATAVQPSVKVVGDDIPSTLTDSEFVGQSEPVSAATPGEVCDEDVERAEEPTKNELVIDQAEPVIATDCIKTLDILDGSVVLIGPYTPDPYDPNGGVASIEIVDVETLSTIKEIPVPETVTSFSEEVEHDSFSNIHLGNDNATDLTVGPQAHEIFTGLARLGSNYATTLAKLSTISTLSCTFLRDWRAVDFWQIDEHQYARLIK